VTGTRLLLVLVRCKVLPALTLVMVVMTSESELVVIKVLEGVTVSSTVEVDCSEELVASEEELESGV